MAMILFNKLLDFSISITILVCFFGIIGLLGGYSAGVIDLSSKPTVHAEENTTGVPHVPASEHPNIDGEKLENQVFNRVNDKRNQVGKDPFVHSEQVRLIARVHSKDMAEREFFNHTNPDGDSSKERHAKYDGCDITNENIAKWGSLPTSDEAELAQDIVEGWTNSTGHNTTMTSDYYHVSGVGVYVTENRSLYVTMNFCREHPNA